MKIIQAWLVKKKKRGRKEKEEKEEGKKRRKERSREIETEQEDCRMYEESELYPVRRRVRGKKSFNEEGVSSKEKSKEKAVGGYVERAFREMTKGRSAFLYMESDEYYVGVICRKLFEEVDYAYNILLRVYRFFHREFARARSDRERMLVMEKIRNYLEKTGFYDEGTVSDMLEAVEKGSLLRLDYETYKRVLFQVKETFKEEFISAIPHRIRNSEGFKKALELGL